MYQHVAHSGHAAPRNIGIARAEIRRHALRCFADYFRRSDDGILGFLVSLKLSERHVCNERLKLSRII